jgi:hypothetical protein
MRNIQLQIANNINNIKPDDIQPLIAKGGHWELFGNKFINFLNTGNPEFSIFADSGNIKLPFLSFSSLAIATCPGAGDCANFCYSLKAWRYPAAFFRQLQNAILMQTTQGKQKILQALDYQLNRKKFRSMDKVDFRLYVDGDFSSLSDVEFWFTALNNRPQLQAYGYSKSFNELLAYTGTIPVNYVLNISSGHSHDQKTVNRVKALRFTRNEFIAVKTDTKIKATDLAKPETRKLVRDKFKALTGLNSFACPGRCGSCTKAGHACGNPAVKMPIVIPLH